MITRHFRNKIKAEISFWQGDFYTCFKKNVIEIKNLLFWKDLGSAENATNMI